MVWLIPWDLPLSGPAPRLANVCDLTGQYVGVVGL